MWNSCGVVVKHLRQRKGSGVRVLLSPVSLRTLGAISSAIVVPSYFMFHISSFSIFVWSSGGVVVFDLQRKVSRV